MSRWLFSTLMGLVCLSGQVVFAVDMGIVTGREGGTYYKIGENVSTLVASHNINLKVLSSTGSLDNVGKVYDTPGVQLGIVQSDVLKYISQVAGTPEQRRIVSKVKMVFPLYPEEVHVLATGDIKDFVDLEGKRVAIDGETSGSNLTARLLFFLSGVKPADTKPIGGKDAITALRKGEVDAMIYVAGRPVTLFQQEVSNDDKFHLLPVREKNILEFYLPKQIPERSYSWQEEAVDTVAVQATLMTYDYKGENCANVGKLAKIVRENLPWLKVNGHKKWEEVDVDLPLKGWEQYSCVQEALRGSGEPQGRPGALPFPLPPIQK